MNNKTHKKGALALVASFMMMSSAIAQDFSIQKSAYGVKVTNCSFDYDNEDFCTDTLLKKYANVLKSRKSNFDKNKLLFIFESKDKNLAQNHHVFRAVVIEKKTHIVVPLRYALSKATGDYGKKVSVNSKGEDIEFNFNKQSNKFCFKGTIDAYRDSYSYDPEYYPEFCFSYESKRKFFSKDN